MGDSRGVRELRGVAGQSPARGGSGKEKRAPPVFLWSEGETSPLVLSFDFDFKDFDFEFDFYIYILFTCKSSF
jgi:hypothetical protein